MHRYDIFDPEYARENVTISVLREIKIIGMSHSTHYIQSMAHQLYSGLRSFNKISSKCANFKLFALPSAYMSTTTGPSMPAKISLLMATSSCFPSFTLG